MKEICKTVQDILNIPITFEEIEDKFPNTYIITCENKKVKVTLALDDKLAIKNSQELISMILDQIRK